VNFTSCEHLKSEDLAPFDAWHPPSNTHTYRLLIFKELFRPFGLINLSLKDGIITQTQPSETKNARQRPGVLVKN
jgi:hypothetical protein